jgi:RimJ/RimL family protein N-acetyltransferase
LKPLRPAYPIHTDRLLIRPFEEGDLEPLLRLESREDVARYVYNEPRARSEVEERIARFSRETTLEKEGDGMDLAMVLTGSGELIGKAFIQWNSEQHELVEIGYVVHPDHQGRGYATESARELVRMALGDMEAHRVIGRLDARNLASARVLENAGMRREAHLVENEFVKGEWASEVVYALLGSEHRQAATRPPAPPGTAP